MAHSRGRPRPCNGRSVSSFLPSAVSWLVYSQIHTTSQALRVESGGMKKSTWMLVCALLVWLGPRAADAQTIAGGARHTVVATPDGAVWTWGSNSNGQLGEASAPDRSTPAAVPLITDAIGVSAGSLHTLALRANGTVLAWAPMCTGNWVMARRPRVVIRCRSLA